MPGGDDPYHDPGAEKKALEHALAFFAANREGVLRFGEDVIPLKFVADRETGRLVAAVPVAIFYTAEHILFVPEDDDDALQLLLTPEQVGERDATDRWQAYHGEPDHVRWAEFWVDSVRHGPWVFDGDAFMEPNPLAGSETAMCKRVNADREVLIRLCDRFASTHVESPVCVGVVPHGIYVRARFGVILVPFEAPCRDAGEATATIERMIGASG